MNNEEPAASRVEAVLPQRPLMSWMNVGEVAYITERDQYDDTGQHADEDRGADDDQHDGLEHQHAARDVDARGQHEHGREHGAGGSDGPQRRSRGHERAAEHGSGR